MKICKKKKEKLNCASNRLHTEYFDYWLLCNYLNIGGMYVFLRKTKH